MKSLLFASTALLITIGLITIATVGCAKKNETETTKQTEVTAPGGTTTVTETTTIEKTGNNPPAPVNP